MMMASYLFVGPFLSSGAHTLLTQRRRHAIGMAREAAVTIGTAFHTRTAPLNRRLEWREWSGYHAASLYAQHHDIEYNAVREGVGVIDVSPLYKYRVSGRDAMRFVDRVITRDATKLGVGQVYYTCWCDEHGKVVDDGTLPRLGENSFRWTAAQ